MFEEKDERIDELEALRWSLREQLRDCQEALEMVRQRLMTATRSGSCTAVRCDTN